MKKHQLKEELRVLQNKYEALESQYSNISQIIKETDRKYTKLIEHLAREKLRS